MSQRLTRALLRLYPRGVRRRYGPELLDLQDQLSARGELSRFRLTRDAIYGAVLARSSRQRALFFSVAGVVLGLVVAGAILSWDIGHPRRSAESSARVVAAVVAPPGRSSLPYGTACEIDSGACSLKACIVFISRASTPASTGTSVRPAEPPSPRRRQAGCAAHSADSQPHASTVSQVSAVAKSDRQSDSKKHG